MKIGSITPAACAADVVLEVIERCNNGAANGK